MKRTWLIAPTVSALILTTSLLLPHTSLASTAITLTPTSYVSLTGADGGQDVSVLAAPDQTGTTNDTSNSLTLTTPLKAKYKGYSVFELSTQVDPATITSIQMSANYYGPASRQQTWTWSIYSWAGKKWITLGNSKLAVANTWATLSFTLKGSAATFKNYVGPVHQLMLVMVQSNNANYDAALDYEALNVTTSADVTITPPPTWTPPPSHPIWHPAPGTTWQWQLTEPIDTSYNVQMYDVDLNDTPQSTIDQLHSQGRTVICYFSPGSYENWRDDANQFPKIVVGKKYIGWAGEYWLDIRQMGVLAPIMRDRLDLAVAKGCDGVEPDNIHGFTQPTGFPLTYDQQMTYNMWLANEAHIRSLSIGLKNDLEQIPDLVTTYDWTLNEQCYEFDECDLLQPFIAHGKAVFGTEYNTKPADFCLQANAAQYSFIRKHLDLDAWVIPCWSY